MHVSSDWSTLQDILFSDYSVSLACVNSEHIQFFFQIAGLKFSMNKSQDALVPWSPVTSRDEEAGDFGSCTLVED